MGAHVLSAARSEKLVTTIPFMKMGLDGHTDIWVYNEREKGGKTSVRLRWGI